ILLLLTAYFQSFRLAVVVVSTTPAVIAGVVLALVLTRTTLNIQSFMGAIMAIGVAVANAILLATFAEQARTQGMSAFDAPLDEVGVNGPRRPAQQAPRHERRQRRRVAGVPASAGRGAEDRLKAGLQR